MMDTVLSTLKLVTNISMIEIRNADTYNIHNTCDDSLLC
jgi:hypothetical protein